MLLTIIFSNFVKGSPVSCVVYWKLSSLENYSLLPAKGFNQEKCQDFSPPKKKKENKYTCYSLKITLPTIIAMIRCIHVSLTVIDFPYKYCEMLYKINEKSCYGKKKRFEITTWIIKRGAKTFFWTMAYFIKRIRTRTRTLKSENWTFSCQNSLYW